jgi:HSP20 family protein
VLTLVIVPALYTVMDDLQTRLFGTQRQPSPAAPVPAVEPPTTAMSTYAGTDGSSGTNAVRLPLNVVDRGSSYVVRAPLPGARQEDVEVSIEGHRLTIRAASDGNGREDASWLVREYGPGTWERTLALPQEVDSGGVDASYIDGILELQLPKVRPAPRRVIPIRNRSAQRTDRR